MKKGSQKNLYVKTVGLLLKGALEPYAERTWQLKMLSVNRHSCLASMMTKTMIFYNGGVHPSTPLLPKVAMAEHTSV